MEHLDERTSRRLSTSLAEADPYICGYLARLSWLVAVREQSCWELGTVERLVACKHPRTWSRESPLATQTLEPSQARHSEHNKRTGAPGTTKVMQMQLQRRPSGLPDWLYIAIVAALGLYFVIGAIAWATFIYNGIPVPDSFATILATIAGGLVGVLAPTAGPARSAEPRQQEPGVPRS
jgi:hypothetical protein